MHFKYLSYLTEDGVPVLLGRLEVAAALKALEYVQVEGSYNFHLSAYGSVAGPTLKNDLKQSRRGGLVHCLHGGEFMDV